MKNVRVMVAVPSGDMIHANTAFAITHNVCLLMAAGAHVMIQNTKTCNLPISRQQLAQESLDQGCTHLLFIDSDMVLAPKTALALIEHDRDIVGTFATRRQFPIETIGVKLDGSRFTKDDTGLKGAKTLGTGVMLIKTKVFKALPKPWFMLRYLGTEGQEWRSGDTEFCINASEAGFKIFCDCDISKTIGHIGSHTYSIHDGDA